MAGENSAAAGFSTNSPSPNITPELRREIALSYVGCLDETELVDLIAAARGEPEPADDKPVPLAERIRTAEAAGDWITAMALKTEQIRQLQKNP